MKLSLASWSVHRLFRATSDPLKLLNLPALVASRLGLQALELNSQFFPSREGRYLKQLLAASEQARVRLLNIAIDEVGDMAVDSDRDRTRAVQNYARWIPVAGELGCVAVRANTGGMGIIDVDRALVCCIDSFRRLCDTGVKHGVTVLVSNRGGISSRADHITYIVEEVRLTHGVNAIGTLPDFGEWGAEVDRYAQLSKILRYAKAVHAEVGDMDDQLEHHGYDLERCVRLTRQSGYSGFLGILFSGNGDPIEGIRRAIAKLSPLL